MQRKQIVHIALGIGVIGAILYMMQNCGEMPVAGVKSLDNFAAGKTVVVNACSAREDLRSAPERNQLKSLIQFDGALASDPAQAPQRDAMTKELESILTAVPPSVQKIFVKLGGSIVISPRSRAVCAGGAGGPPALTYDNCFISGTTPFSTDKSIVTIVMAPGVTNLRANLVREFGYVLSNFILRFGVNPNAGGAVPVKYAGQEPEAVTRAKLELAQAFLSDLRTVKLFPVDRFRDRLGGFNQQVRIANAVFAEAFDSYFCNDWGPFDASLAKNIAGKTAPVERLSDLRNSRLAMNQFFPKTFAVFTRQVTQFGLVAEKTAAGAGLALTEEDESTGLPAENSGTGDADLGAMVGDNTEGADLAPGPNAADVLEPTESVADGQSANPDKPDTTEQVPAGDQTCGAELRLTGDAKGLALQQPLLVKGRNGPTTQVDAAGIRGTLYALQNMERFDRPRKGEYDDLMGDRFNKDGDLIRKNKYNCKGK